MNGGTRFVPFDQAVRGGAGSSDGRKRPTVEGAGRSFEVFHGHIHAPSLAYETVPERKWAVDNLIPASAVTLFSGDGGSGKSTLALQMACSTVLGAPWLGREVRAGKVAYLSCEDDKDELHRRLDSICESEAWSIADLEGLELFDRVDKVNSILACGRDRQWDVTPWWVSFSNWARDNGPSLIVCDSLYDFFPMHSQLDQAVVRLFMGTLRELARDVGAAIVVLWHPSKSGMESGDGTSGNVAFRNASRSMLYMTLQDKDDPMGPRVITGKKANYGPAGGEIVVRWEGGRFVQDRPAEDSGPFFANLKRERADKAFMSALADLLKRGQAVSPAKNAYNYAPRMIAETPYGKGLKVDDLEGAMRRLMAVGRIGVGVVGRGADRHVVRGLVILDKPAKGEGDE